MTLVAWAGCEANDNFSSSASGMKMPVFRTAFRHISEITTKIECLLFGQFRADAYILAINKCVIGDLKKGGATQLAAKPQKGEVMRRIVTTFALGAAMLPTMLHAQSACAERHVLVEKLNEKYGEVFAGGGLQNANSVFEVWMSAEKGTWTILKTNANGTACVMASGTNWLVSLPSQQVAGIPG